MRNTNKEALLANHVVTQDVIKEYQDNIPALARECFALAEDDRYRNSLLRYYEKALELLLARAA